MSRIQKVLLVNPYPKTAKTIMEASHLPPVGLAYTASYLESKGVICKIIDAALLKLDLNAVLQEIKAFQPEMVGISFNIATITETLSLSQTVKGQLGVHVILGGPASAGELQQILEKSKADCVVRGEGELITWNIVQALNNNESLDTVKGLAFLKESKVHNTPVEENIQNLDELPFPAYHLLPDLDLYKNRSRKHPIVPLVTHRGCPYSCTFCGSQNTGFRARTPENVLKEMEYMVTRFGVKQFDILDDNFTLDEGRAEQILDLIISKNWNIGITFPNGLRADRLTENLVKKMHKAGVYRTGIGIESGNQGIVDGIKKGLKLGMVRQSIRWLRANDIIVFGYFQFGMPGETKATMQQTIEFAREINPHWANFGITTPLPGTVLYKQLSEQGLITETTTSLGQGFYAVKESHYSPEGLTKEDIEGFQQKAWRSFYFRPKKVLDVMKTIRSYRELEWTVSIAAPILKGLVGNMYHSASSKIKGTFQANGHVKKVVTG